MGVPKRLTDQQQRFSELYVYNEGRMTPYECAKEAGYAPESARVRASELRNPRRYPLVVKFIGELREEVQNKYEVTFEKHIKELARLREEALKKGSFSSAVNAEVARGKAGGLYIEQKIIKTGKLEDMSEQELETRMKEIVDQYSPILDAKPIEDLKKEVRTRITPLKVVKEIPDDVDSEKDTDDKPDQNKDKAEKKVVRQEKKYI
jgi:phage terminase small subunit